jgi:carbon monoxide dehydrogenase subunit G
VTAIRVAIELDASPAAVWAMLEPIERHVEWMADAERIRFLGTQTRGVGTRFTCRTAVGPIRLDDEMEITEWEPERRMGVRHSGVVTGTGRFVLEPVDGGRRTALSWTEKLDFPWFLGGPAGERLGGRQVMGAIWRRNLRRFKRLVERSA